MPQEVRVETQTVVVNQGGGSGAKKALTTVGCVVALFMAVPILAAVIVPAIIEGSRRSGPAGDGEARIDTGELLIVDAADPDTIYRASITEGGQTVEDVWPRVITDLPDSCYYPDPYDECAAFRFTVTGAHELVQLQASSPIDLVMTLVRLDPDGSMEFAGWNEDGPHGTDPLITVVLPAGDYLAVLTNLGGWESGEARFVRTVLMPEVPSIEPDTSFTVVLSERLPKVYYFVTIETGRYYVFETFGDGLDTYIDLVTAGGSVLTDDDGGEDWGDARLAFTASALHEGEAMLVVRPYYYSPDYGQVEIRVTSTD